MRKVTAGVVLAGGVFLMWTAVNREGQAQAPPGIQSVGGAQGTLFTVPAAPPLYRLEDAMLRWPLPLGGHRYSAIDGKHLHTFVDEQAAISRRFRDQGHPQYWGRIIGSSADAESAHWLFDKFRQAGLSDVRRCYICARHAASPS